MITKIGKLVLAASDNSFNAFPYTLGVASGAGAGVIGAGTFRHLYDKAPDLIERSDIREALKRSDRQSAAYDALDAEYQGMERVNNADYSKKLKAINDKFMAEAKAADDLRRKALSSIESMPGRAKVAIKHMPKKYIALTAALPVAGYGLGKSINYAMNA